MQRLDAELGRLIAAIRAGVDPALAAPQTREIQGPIAQARSLIERSERSRGSVGLLMEATGRVVLVETRDLVQLVRQADRIERAALSSPWTSASGTKEKRLFGIWRGARWLRVAQKQTKVLQACGVSQQPRSTFVLRHPSEIVQALVGLKDVRVLHYERRGADVELMVEQVVGDVRCPSCKGPARVKERPVVRYVDLPVYATPMRLAWKKHRMLCPDPACVKRTWVLCDHRIAAKNCLLTTRAANWATVQVGTGRTVSEVAGELGCDWHTVNEAVTTYGEALLSADRKRMNHTAAIGLDETAFVRLGRRRTDYATTVADVEHHQIIDILPSRNFIDVAGWIDKQPAAWKDRIRFGTLDMSATYAAVYSVVLPKAHQVVDPFHAVSLANRALDAIRRRVQHETLGHRGRRDDPLYRIRRVLLRGEERLEEDSAERLASLLSLGDPNGEVAIAYRVKERLRDFYATSDPDEAREILEELEHHCLKRSMPPEIQRLGRTIRAWFEKLCNFHLARHSNGPTEALNNLIKRIKRIAFGFRNFKN